MKVQVIANTPDIENLIYNAAKICYSKEGYIKHYPTEDQLSKFLTFLRDHGHLSPFEHASITFSISGISRACSHQLVRHRIASYTQKSQRYTDPTNFTAVIPKTIADSAKATAIFVKFMDEASKVYDALREENIPAEDSRFILPNATTTDIIVTMNIRELINFFNLRLSKGAQWEIKALAQNMLKLATNLAPHIFGGVKFGE